MEFRKGTFFERSRLAIFTILAFIEMWVNNVTLLMISRTLEISASPTCVDWSSFCREVLLNAFFDSKEKLGGPEKTVEIDESKFGKRKYNRGFLFPFSKI